MITKIQSIKSGKIILFQYLFKPFKPIVERGKNLFQGLGTFHKSDFGDNLLITNTATIIANNIIPAEI